MIAPTGTIGLVMDCDTTGIEPDFALVKFKKLAGGGYFKIINQAVPEALRTLGYGEAEIAEMEAYAVGHGTLAQAPAINHSTLKAKGFTDEVAAEGRGALKTAFDIKFVFNSGRWARSSSPSTLKIPAETLNEPGFDLLGAPRLLQEGHRGGQRARLRGDDAGRRAAPGRRAPAGVRLRQPVRPQGQALPVGRRATST